MTADSESLMKKILLVRLSAIGDVVMASGLLNAIKAQYPNAQITWLVEPAAGTLLHENPLVDQVIVWPKAEWKALWQQKKYRELWQTLRAFRARLKGENFDLALDTQGILKSAFLTWLSGAPRRVGLGKKEGSHWFHTETVPKIDEKPNMCSEYIDLAEHLGLHRADYRMRVEFSAQTQDKIKTQLAQQEVSGRYAVFCPFTTRPQKHWFDEHWVALAHALRAEGMEKIVILGGPGDREHAQRLSESFPSVNLAGETSLLGAAAVIDGAALLVGVDTGLTHIGIARNTPTIAIFGSTRPYLEPLNESGRVLYENFPCAPCRRHPTCNGEFTCLKVIDANKVMDVAKELLA